MSVLGEAPDGVYVTEHDADPPVPLRVHGQTETGEKFVVKTLSHSVSLHGASIELEQGVVLGEILHLENEHTKEKAQGKVVAIRRRSMPPPRQTRRNVLLRHRGGSRGRG